MSSSYICITTPKPTPRRACIYFLSLLVFFSFLNIWRNILPPPLNCIDDLKTSPKYQLSLHKFWNQSQYSTGTTRFVPCLNFSKAYRPSSGGGGGDGKKYMMVVVSGGLNQQRNQIIDAVVIARILGAVLVHPVLQVNQVWGDDSEFSDIFDEWQFKERLKDDVMVVSSLPATHLRKRRVKGPPLPLRADEAWIRTHYMHKLSRDSVLLLKAFDSRLSKDLHTDLQKLRCKVAFEALKFQPWIDDIGEKLVKRMGEEGPYMALHLRLEMDVWVRTGCLPGLGEEIDLMINRERALKPKLLTSRSKLTAQERYALGLCPLNAMEISRLLKGLGAPNSTRIYLAGGDPFGGNKALKSLRLQFPNLYNKWSLGRPGELDDLHHKPSVLAAIDYIVCLKSQVFMANHGGNMARSLQGHRTYMGYGKLIRPNKKLLVNLFMNKSLSNSELEKRIEQIHAESSDLASLHKTKPNRDVIAFPIPNCMCSRKNNSNLL